MFEAQLNNTYGHKPEVWNAAKQQARSFLVGIARKRGQTYYSELTQKINAIQFQPDDRIFHHLLGQLSWESDAAGEGMISVLVTHKEGDGLPGPGFFSLAKELGRDVSDRVKCWADEMNRVHNAFAKR